MSKCKMRTALVAVLLVAAPAGASSSTTGVSTTPAELAPLSDAELDARIEQTRQSLRDRPGPFCDLATFLLERNRRNPARATLGEAEFASAVCALATNSINAFWEHIERAEAQLPVVAGGEQRVAVESLALDIAIGTHDFDRYADHVAHIGQINDPTLLARLNGDVIFATIMQADAPRREAALLALARSVGFAGLPDYFKQAIAEYAMVPALQAGDRDLALRLLEADSDPDHFLPILIDRRYAPIWPEAERRAGPRMSRVNADFLAIARAEYAAEPGNRWAFDDLVRALVVEGRNSEAIDLIATLPRDPASVARYEEGDAWALNAAATAFDREGRRAEADAAHDLIANIPAEGHPWLVPILNMGTGRLADQGRWDKAWAAGLRALEVAQMYDSGYSKAVAAANLVCISPHVADEANTQRANAVLNAGQGEFPFPAAVAALCLGNRDKARELAIAAIRGKDSRSSILHGAQPPEAGKLGTGLPSALPEFSDFVRTDSVLSKEFEQVGRLLPTSLYYPRSAN